MTVKKKQFVRGITIRPDDVAFEGISGELKVALTSQKLQAYLDSASREILTADQVQTLTNKTLNVDNNTVSNIEVDNLKAGVLNTSGTLTGASDLQVPSALAVKTYADAVATTAQTNLDNHINDATDAHDASAISNVPAGTIAATDVQAAINELDGDIQAHITDATDAHDASAISVVPAGSISSNNVQAALEEIQTDVDTNATNLSNHLSDAVDAHDASAISNVPAGTISATDVQAAINELDGDIQAHITDTVDAHDASAISVVPAGNLTSTNVQDALEEIQTQVDTLTGDVAGPASSTDNAIVRFDGTTGKLIQNSAVTIDDTGALNSSARIIVGDALNESVISRLRWQGITAENADSDSTSGSNVTLPSAAQPIRTLTNAGLVSVDMIPAGVSSQVLTLVNKTGNDITINNETGATAANRILTGTGASLTLKNNASISLRYISGAAPRWHIIGGTGASDAQSLDVAFQLTSADQASTWSSGNNASFLGGGTLSGTFVNSTTNPLNGTSSYLYTQAAGSLNDYIASPVQSIPIKFRGNNATFYFNYTYDGGSSDIEAVVYDVTNATKLTTANLSLVPVSSTTSSLYKINVFIPTTCTQIRIGFQTKVLNSGKILKFDDVVLSSDATRYSDTSLITDWQSYTPTFQGFGTPSAVEFFWRRVGANVEISGRFTSGTATSVEARVSLPNNYTSANTSIIPTIKNIGNYAVNAAVGSTTHTILIEPSVTYVTFSYQTGAIPNLQKRNGNDFASAGVAIGVIASVPIAGLTASNPQIITASESFSTDTAQLVYAPSSSFTLATLSNAPVGTFITFTYAAGTNTRTQTTTAPTQSTSSMNTNGIQLFARSRNVASTAASPAAFAVQVGKGLKGYSLALYKSLAKVTPGSLDKLYYGTNSTGIQIRSYDELTGILYVDAAYQDLSSNDTAIFTFSDITQQNNGYVVINASKSPALVGVPQVLPRIATLSDVKASGTDGGTATSGSYQTRVLNTLSDPQNVGITLSANQFTLQPGSYYIEASVPAFSVGRFKAKLRNITDSLDTILGTSEISNPTDTIATRSNVVGIVTVTSAKTFEIQTRVNTTFATQGLGVASSFGDSETYTLVKIQKIQ